MANGQTAARAVKILFAPMKNPKELSRHIAVMLLTSITLVLSSRASTLDLADLELYRLEHGLSAPKNQPSIVNRSLVGKPITIGGKVYEKGIGSHAPFSGWIDVNGATRFTALVGMDDESKVAKAGVVFQVLVDGTVKFESDVMHKGDPAKPVDIDIKGASSLRLIINPVGGRNAGDLADWAEARFVYDGKKPQTSYGPKEAPVILTPPAPNTPRINGARVVGVGPGHPFLFTIPATGDRPLHFTSTGLPEGISLDPDTGRLTGIAPAKPGEYRVTLSAKNAKGEDSKPLRIRVGDAICLTPPMGWSSWYCFALYVNQQNVAAEAQAMVDSGLINHGWSYINIDDAWQGDRGGPFKAIQGNPKSFSDLPALSRAVHGLGLKLGIYSTPWKGSYLGRTGGSCDNEAGIYDKKDHTNGIFSFAKQDAAQWAAWEIDFLKYDWSPIDVPSTQAMSEALRASGRDIVFSLSNGASLENGESYQKWSNLWRTTGDIQAYWKSMSSIGFQRQEKWNRFAGPGHWNDPDILQIGLLNNWKKLGQIPTGLTVNEQYTQFSLWSLLAAPLIFGGDMTKLDPFTLGLLTNDEVIAVDQDPLGKAALPVSRQGQTEVWARDLEDGSKAVGLFNLSEQAGDVSIDWTALGLSGKQKVRDLWRQKDLGIFDGQFTATVPRHGVVLINVKP